MDLENFEVYYVQTNPYEPFQKIPLSHLMKYWVKKNGFLTIGYQNPH